MLLKTSYAEGVLNQDEAELIRGYLQLKDASVKEIMRPRDEVLFYDLDEPLESSSTSSSMSSAPESPSANRDSMRSWGS